MHRVHRHRTSRIRTRLVLACVALVTAFLAAATPALAWRAVVLEPTATTLDLGRIDDAPAVFVTLPGARAPVELTASTTGSADGTRITVFIPDRRPEERLRGGELPTVTIVDDPEARFVRDEERYRLRDPATGLRFRRIGFIDVTGSTRAATAMLTLRIERGDEPARALVVIGDAAETDQFELDEPTTVPGTVARMRLWYDTPPAGTNPRLLEVTQRDQARLSPAVIISAIVSVAMVVLAIWWVLRGRAESRRRGAQRDPSD